MKLLFDENLSSRLVQQLARDFPSSAHVDTLGLHGKSDAEVWTYARDHDFVIVSKDDDFRQLSFLHGAPPKVVCLSVGNAVTDAIARLMIDGKGRIEALVADAEESLLILRAV